MISSEPLVAPVTAEAVVDARLSTSVLPPMDRWLYSALNDQLGARPNPTPIGATSAGALAAASSTPVRMLKAVASHCRVALTHSSAAFQASPIWPAKESDAIGFGAKRAPLAVSEGSPSNHQRSTMTHRESVERAIGELPDSPDERALAQMDQARLAAWVRSA